MKTKNNINKRAFIEVFSIPELRSIIGYQKILILIFILFVSLIVIGIGNGSKEYLKEKMDDPVIRFIDVEIPLRFGDNSRSKILNTYRDKEKQEKWGYTGPFPLSEDWLLFKTVNNTSHTAKGTILDEQDPFYKHMSETKENIISHAIKLHKEDFGIIVTENLLKELGYKDDPKTQKNELHDVSYIKYYDKSEGIAVNIPITGIVTKLRKKFEFMMSHYCYNFLVKNFEKFEFKNENSIHSRYLRFFIYNPNQLQVEELKNLGFSPDFSIAHNGDYGIIMEIETTGNNNDIIERVKKISPSALRIYDFFKTSTSDSEIIKGSDDFYTFLFKKIDNVEAFLEQDLKKNFGLEIDAIAIKIKKNFSFFNKLTNLLSFSLIGFSILSIIFFVTNLLISHINNNKKNLGTLKAFGLSNNYILITYSFITFAIIIPCFAISYILSHFLGDVILDLIAKGDSGYMSQVSYINFNFSWLFVGLVILPCVIILFRVLGYLHNKTPGDLIYERK